MARNMQPRDPEADVRLTRHGLVLTAEVLAQRVQIYDSYFHRHPNGGGWVEESARVAEDAYIAWSAMVHARATVGTGAEIGENARVLECAHVPPEARVADNVVVDHRGPGLGAMALRSMA